MLTSNDSVPKAVRCQIFNAELNRCRPSLSQNLYLEP